MLGAIGKTEYVLTTAHIVEVEWMVMGMREKLIELIKTAVNGCATYWAGLIADHLIANGVTIQKWIPVTERLPETFGEFAVTIKTIEGRAYPDYADYDPFAKRWYPSLYFAHSSKVTHWMPLPEPPKGVE